MRLRPDLCAEDMRGLLGQCKERAMDVQERIRTGLERAARVIRKRPATALGTDVTSDLDSHSASLRRRRRTGKRPRYPSFRPRDEVPAVLAELVAQAADLVPLVQDRQALGELPSEDELIAHFVVPFLRALGWPPERIDVQ